MAFRIYLTDSIYYRNEGKCINIRYAKIINPDPVDTRSGDEIASEIIEKLGLRVKNEFNGISGEDFA